MIRMIYMCGWSAIRVDNDFIWNVWVLNIKLKIISLRVVLTSTTNNSILHEAGFLDAFLIDLVQLKF